MQKKLYKELWTLRFQKMLTLEEQGIQEYQNLLKDCVKAKADDSVKDKLKKLIADETRHAKYVQELLKVVDAQEE